MDRHLILTAKDGFSLDDYASELFEKHKVKMQTLGYTVDEDGIIGKRNGIDNPSAARTTAYVAKQTAPDGTKYITALSAKSKETLGVKSSTKYEEKELPEAWVVKEPEPIEVETKPVVIKKPKPVVVKEPIVYKVLEENPSKNRKRLVYVLEAVAENIKQMTGTIPFKGKCIASYVASDKYDPSKDNVIGMWEWVGDEMKELIELDRKAFLNYLPDQVEYDDDFKVISTKPPVFHIPSTIMGWPEII